MANCCEIFRQCHFPNIKNNQSVREGVSRNKLIMDELRYDRRSLAQQYENYLLQKMTEQRHVHDQIINAVNLDCGQLFFLYGHGGTGKTFIWKTLAARLRSKGEIVLTVASSSIASLLLPGGRTAQSRFAISLTPDEYSTCNIKQGTLLAELIIRTKLIIWDEAPMMDRFCFEALDQTMRDLLRVNNESRSGLSFGGKTVVLGGNFRQILPVITKGSRQDIVNTSINSSYLWQQCKLLRLTQNMHLRATNGDENTQDLRQFANWILDVGDGKLGKLEDSASVISIPPELLIKEFHYPIEAIVQAIYGDYLKDSTDFNHLQGRAILAPTTNIVEEVNHYMLSLNNNETKAYLSSNSASFKGGNNI